MNDLEGYRLVWFLILLAALMLVLAIRGISSGEVIVIYRTARRSENGVLFWTSIGIHLLVAAAAIVSIFMQSRMVTSLTKEDWLHLGASAALLYNAISGIITGSLILFRGTVRRADDPTLFWVAFTISAAGGIALALMTLF